MLFEKGFLELARSGVSGGLFDEFTSGGDTVMKRVRLVSDQRSIM